MPLAASYLPNGQLFMPRSYVRGIVVRCDQPGAVLVGNVLTFWIDGPPDARCVVTFDPTFVAWNSNARSLDHMLLSGTYSYPPDPTTFDLPFYLIWEDDLVEPSFCLSVDATYGADRVFFALPAAPPGYWMPPFSS